MVILLLLIISPLQLNKAISYSSSYRYYKYLYYEALLGSIFQGARDLV